MWWRTALSLAAALTLGACAGAPTAPSVMVLPGAGKSLEQFQADDAACRQWAAQQLGAAKGDSWMLQRSYDISYQQCMYARDNQIPGASAPQRVPGPPPPPSAPPPPPPPPGRMPR